MAGPGTKVGTGYVDIHADFDPMRRELAQLKASWSTDSRGLGDAFNKNLGPALANVTKQIRSTTGDVDGLGSRFRGLDGATAATRRTLDGVGESLNRNSTVARGFGDSLAHVRGSTTDAGAGLRAFGNYVNATRTAVANARTTLGGFGDDLRGVRAAAAEARSGITPFGVELERTRQHVRAFGDEVTSTSSNTRGTFRGLIRESDMLGRSFTGLGGRTTILNARFQLLRNAIGVLKWPAIITGAGLAAQALSALGAGVVALTSALGPAVGVLGALPGALAAAAQGFGVFKLATLGVADSLREQLRQQTAAGSSAISSANSQRSAARAIASAQEAVRSARLGVADATRRVSDAERAYKDSLRALVDAEAQVTEAHDAARVAQLGLSAARDAARQHIESVRQTLTDSLLAEERATFSLEDARRALAQLSSPASEQALAEAHNSVADAVRGEERAVLALEDARAALDQLTRGASELDLADATDSVQDATRAQERAALHLGDAQERLNDLLSDPRADPRDIAKARLDLADAENAVGDADRAVIRARERLAELEKPPSEHELAKARLAVRDAEDAVADAARGTIEAKTKLTELETPASEYELAKARLAVREAEDALADARRAHLRTARELIDVEARGIAGSQEVAEARRAIAEADRAVIEAEEGVRAAMRAASDAARGVTDAERGVSEARRGVRLASQGLRDAVLDASASMAAGSLAAARLSQNFDQLPPAAQAFVRTLLALKPRFDELRNVAAAGFFPGARAGLLEAARNFEPVRSVVAATARVLGSLAEQAGHLVGSAGFGRDLELVGGRNAKVIRRMGEATLRVVDALRHVMVAAGPLVSWLSRVALAWATNLDAAARTGRETGRLAAFFERTREVLSRLGSIVGHVAHAFWDIGRAAAPLGRDILAALDRASAGFARWTGSIRGQRSLRDYFADARPAIFETGRLLRDITKSFFRLGTQPGVARLIEQVRTQLLPALERTLATLTRTFAPALVNTLTQVVRLFAQMAGAGGALSSIVKLLGTLAGGLTAALVHVPGLRQMAFAFVGIAGGLKAIKVGAAITGITGLGRSALAAGRAFRLLAAGTAASTVASETSIGATIAAKVAMVASTAASKAWAAAQWLLNAALTANPIGLVVVGLAALVGGIVLAYKKIGWFHDAVDSVFRFLKEHWVLVGALLLGPIVPAIKLIVDHFDDIKRALGDAWDWVKTATSDAWDWIKRHLGIVLPAIGMILTGPIGAAVALVATHWDTVKRTATTVWDAIKAAAKTAWEAIKTAISTPVHAVIGWLRDRWGDVKDFTGAAWQRVKELIGNPIDAAVTRVKGAVGDAKGWLADRWDDIKTTADKAWQRVRDLIGNPISAAVDHIKALIGHGGRDASGLIGWLGGAWDTIKNGLGDFAGDMKDKIVGVFEGAVKTVAGFVNKIIGVLNKIPGVEIPKIDLRGLATGGSFGAAGVDQYATGGEVRRGTVIDRPMIMMGEEAPRWPEWVIPTNPAYRDRARMLLGRAAEAIGFASGGRFSKGELVDLAAASGIANTDVASSVALAESGGDPRAINHNSNGSDDRGLWQINSIHGYNATKLLQPPYNAAATYNVSAGGHDWTPWVTYNSGAYRRFLGAQDNGNAPSGIGGSIESVLSGIGGEIGGILSGGADYLLNKLPNPAEMLPDWLVGTGKWVIDKVSSWVKDQVGDLFGDSPLDKAASSLQRLVRMGTFTTRLDALDVPYGAAGHSGWPINLAGEDCSSTASKLLHAAGFLDSVMTTVTLPSALEPGPGRWVTLHNRPLAGAAGHVVTQIGDKFFATSGENPGGGPGFTHPSASYLATLPQKLHPPGLAKGGVIQAPFVGSYLTGGVVPEDGLAYVHKHETITPANAAGDGVGDIRIYVGDREIRDIVRVEVTQRERAAHGALLAGTSG
jgi:hypothetical protein